MTKGICLAAAALALAMRWHNVRQYPADWGFDASFNWRYIISLSRTWQLPALDAGWSTADPPLYFALAGGLARLFPNHLLLIPLLNALLGISIAVFASMLVRRAAPGDPTRKWLAGLLVLYLPAHIQMSAMVNEEMLAAACTALVLVLIANPLQTDSNAGRGRALQAGLVAGAAALAKLSGGLAAATGAAGYIRAASEASIRRLALGNLALFILCVLAVAGWFYLRTWWFFGSIQPVGLPAHAIMQTMPPGSREWLDFVRFPLATFSDPQLLHPDLLRSVWGSLYASVWFDAHRMFLPAADAAVTRLGTVTLLLALLPTAAFGAGLVRAFPRAMRGDPVDLPLVFITCATLLAFAVFAWRNPWFAVLKGTSLLGLCIPYAVYASDSLLRWARRDPKLGWAIGSALVALAACTVASGTFNGLFLRESVSGLPWSPTPTP